MMTAEHDKCNSTQVGMPKKMQVQTPCRQTRIQEFSLNTRGRTYRRFTTLINPKHKHRRLRRPRAAPTHAAAPSSTRRDSRSSLGTLALPPASHCANRRAPTAPRARRGSVGSRGWGQGRVGPERRGAGPRRPGRGRGAGAGRCPAHVGGREQLKVRSGACAVLSRAALARAAAGKAAAAEEEEKEEGGSGGGERRGEDGGGVGLEPSGGASCPGRCRELARRAPIPELHPAVPSSARVRAPAGSAPGLPPE